MPCEISLIGEMHHAFSMRAFKEKVLMMADFEVSVSFVYNTALFLNMVSIMSKVLPEDLLFILCSGMILTRGSE